MGEKNREFKQINIIYIKKPNVILELKKVVFESKWEGGEEGQDFQIGGMKTVSKTSPPKR